MSIEFKRTRDNYRNGTKYPRQAVESLDMPKVSMKKRNPAYKNSTLDSYKAYVDYRKVEKFLRARVNKPVSIVLSELTTALKVFNQNESAENIFYSHINKKDEIDYHGGLYITNGILNYKKQRKYIPTTYKAIPDCTMYNTSHLPKPKIMAELGEKAINEVQLMGNLYIRTSGYTTILANVYIVQTCNAWMYTKCTIVGFGEGFNITRHTTQTRDIVYINYYQSGWGMTTKPKYSFVIK